MTKKSSKKRSTGRKDIRSSAKIIYAAQNLLEMLNAELDRGDKTSEYLKKRLKDHRLKDLMKYIIEKTS